MIVEKKEMCKKIGKQEVVDKKMILYSGRNNLPLLLLPSCGHLKKVHLFL